MAGQVGEPLTGRKRTLTLYPISQPELLETYNRFELKEHLADFLIYGTYPEVVMASTKREKIQILEEITNSYLVKDILAFDRIRNSNQLLNLLKLIAFQVGSEVSLHELGTKLGMNYKTVERYVDLLEKAFVLIRLSGFSRNLRNEITKKEKYYFMDNGIRNALIAQFNALSLRNDMGQLWENFFFIERLKYRDYYGVYGNRYFWRTYDQQEVDLVEERDGGLTGFECKWSPNKKIVAPKRWREGYPESEFKVITPENYQDFVLPTQNR